MFKKIVLVGTTVLLLSGCSLQQGGDEKSELSNVGNSPTPQPLQSESLNPTAAVTPGLSKTPAKGEAMTMPQKQYTQATVTTSKGDITFSLYPDKAPKTVANFVAKAQSDFYKGLTFHRVEDWVIQGGDPLGTGTGGGTMPTELSDQPFKIGSVGVARGGDIKVSNDSQFFICTADCSWLSGQYTIFGDVTAGLDVAKQIAVGDKILKVTVK